MTTTHPPSVRDVLGSVRRLRRGHSPKTGADRFTDAYLAAFLLVYGIAAVGWLFDVDLTGASFTFHDTAIWMPVVLFVAMWGIVRHGTWQGPVLYSSPEMQWVVSSPLDRRGLVLARLVRAMTIAAIAGAAGGLLVTIIAATMTDVGIVEVFFSATASVIAVALTSVALAWHTERSVVVSTIVTRSSPLIAAAAALLAAGVATGHEQPVLWSGPWGWASASSIVASGGEVPGWPIMVLLLATLTVVAVASAVVTATDIPDEELWRRAEAKSTAAAAMFFGDLRTLRRVAKRDRARGRVRGRDRTVARPRAPWLVVPKWDLLTLRRDPSRVVTAAILTAGAFVAAVGATERTILGIVAFLAFYAASARLVEPIRVEVEQPEAHLMLPWTWGRVLALHTIVPVVALTGLGWIGILAVGVGRFADASDLVPFAVVTPFAASAFVLAAAISAARKPFPVETLVAGGDASPVLAVLWFLVGPALAAVVINIGFGMLRDGLEGDAQGITSSVLFLAAASTAFGAWLITRKPAAP
jgi:hypothetical protein